MLKQRWSALACIAVVALATYPKQIVHVIDSPHKAKAACGTYRMQRVAKVRAREWVVVCVRPPIVTKER